MNTPTPTPMTDMPDAPEPLGPDDFDAIDTILDDLRTRDDEIPQWEFCEGFMVALICTRRAIPPQEYWPLLLSDDALPPDANAPMQAQTLFTDAIQQQRFFDLWTRRWDEIVASLDAKVEALDDERTYQPEVLDTRGAIAALPAEERADMEGEAIPSFAQIWALGFMFAVENWPEEWAAPRDKEAAQWLDEALQSIVALTEDDTGKPEISMFSEDGPPSISQARVDAFGSAIWAVYDLRQLWRSLGPRVETVRKADEPGRNDPCPCGSGKKYKKCHGA